MDPSKRNPEAEAARAARRIALQNDPSEKQADILSYYGIDPRVPLRHKVERLYENFNLKPDEIAEMLEADLESVETFCAKVDSDMVHAGREYTEEEKRVQRGKAIRKYENLMSSLEESYARGKDEKIASHIIRVRDQLLNLQGIDRDKRGADGSQSLSTLLEQQISALDVDTLARLRAELSEA